MTAPRRSPPDSLAARRRALRETVADALDRPAKDLSLFLERGFKLPLRGLDTYLAAAEKARLSGHVLSTDAPEYRAFRAQLDRELRRAGADVVTPAFARAVRAGAEAGRDLALPLTGVDPGILSGAWNVPDFDQVVAVVTRSYKPALAGQAWLEGQAETVLEGVRRAFVMGAMSGRGSASIARAIRRAAPETTRASALRWARTMQMEAWRDSQAIHYVANSDIIEYQIRIATFDSRVCPACLALHGARIPLGRTIIDHWAGRCIAVPKIRGLDSPVTEGGATWLARQPAAIQDDILGKAAGEAFRAGAFGRDPSAAMIGAYATVTPDHGVFGAMLGVRSWKKAGAILPALKNKEGARRGAEFTRSVAPPRAGDTRT